MHGLAGQAPGAGGARILVREVLGEAQRETSGLGHATRTEQDFRTCEQRLGAVRNGRAAEREPLLQRLELAGGKQLSRCLADHFRRPLEPLHPHGYVERLLPLTVRERMVDQPLADAAR